MIHLDKENFNDLISKGNHLVDFYAEWCGPCKMMGPVLEEIEESVKDKTDIIKVNIDNFNELADQYKVMSIPTLLFIKDGKVIKEEVGYRDNDTLVGIINDTFK